MIKFFRHIRQSLIQKNQMGKYFKYAIGEIILVVIGILIALQINNWNEESKQSRIEQTFLKRLKIDLEENIANLESLIAFQEKRNEGVKAFIKFSLMENSDSIRMIFPHFNTVLRWDDMTINQVTFKEMQSSGKLDIIQNDSIKIKLLQLDQQYQIVLKRNETIKIGHEKGFSEPYGKTVNSMSFFVLDESNKALFPRRYSKEEMLVYQEEFIHDLTDLVNNQVFMNSLIGSKYSHTLVLGEMKEAKRKAEELLSLIKSELE